MAGKDIAAAARLAGRDFGQLHGLLLLFVSHLIAVAGAVLDGSGGNGRKDSQEVICWGEGTSRGH